MPNAIDYIRILEYRANRATIALNLHGFITQQSNGQRISINLAFKDQGEEIERLGQNEIFIGHLPRDAFEDELLPQMLSAGRVYKIRWMMDFSGTNRGYSFVKYVTREEALEGVRQLNNYCIREGRDLIGAKISKDNKGLYFGNLPESCTCEEFVNALVRFEVQGVVGAVMDDKANMSRTSSLDMNNNNQLSFHQYNQHHNTNGRQRNHSRGGYGKRGNGSQRCFVLFESHAAATKARRILMPGEVKFFGRILTIDWARTDISQWDIQSREGFFYCNRAAAAASAVDRNNNNNTFDRNNSLNNHQMEYNHLRQNQNNGALSRFSRIWQDSVLPMMQSQANLGLLSV